MADNTTSQTPIDRATLSATLKPAGQNSTMSIGGALAVICVFVLHAKYSIDFPAGVEVSIGVIATCAAGYFHEFMVILLDKLRRQ